MSCNELTDFQILLIIKLTALSKEKGYIYASNDYLAESLNKSKSVINYHINELIKKGYLTALNRRSKYRKLSLTEKASYLTDFKQVT